MEKLEVLAPAKINITLDITGIRGDGYHEMRMVNHSIALHDTLTFEKATMGIHLACTDARIPVDCRNLVWRVAEKLSEQFHKEEGIAITIDKNIPSEAGLAGGSADAAAAILGLNTFWHLGMSMAEMMTFGACIGADVPYCIHKGTALVEGFGERITPLSKMPNLKVLAVKPPINISTPKAFGLVDNASEVFHPDVKTVIHALEAEDFKVLGECVGNTFEPVVFEKYPEIKAIKEKMRHLGALVSVMSGSGSTVVGYFSDEAAAKSARDSFRQKYPLTFLTEVE